MRPPLTLRSAAAASLLTGAALVAGCGGNDTPSRSAFVEQLRTITSSKVTTAQASCIYDKIRDDPVLLDAALKDASVKLPADIDAKLTKRLAECIVAQRPSSGN